jgi:biotin carboxylase
MKKIFEGRKLLIIGGAFQHVKVVETAKQMGITTYVVDYLESCVAPAKQIADYNYKINIFDIDGITALCKREKIDAVLACNLDICQKPYQMVCERLGLPCFGTSAQFDLLTNKLQFKKLCIQYGLDVIPEYTVDEILKKHFEDFPIFIKPEESSSSNGQTICYSKDEVEEAVKFAREKSRNGNVLVEKYIEDKDDIEISGFMLDGHLYITRIEDRFSGTEGMDHSEIVGIYPSRYYDLYEKNVHDSLEKMLAAIGLNYAPVFFQGFIDGDTIRFYDPGLRLPGAECEKAYERIWNMNLTEMCIWFAMTNSIPKEYLAVKHNTPDYHKYALLLYFPIRRGTIKSVYGEKEIASAPETVAYQTQYAIGDTIGKFYNAKQRYAEIDMVFDSIEQMKEKIEWIYNTFSIIDEEGQEMLFSRFDTNRLNVYL